MTLDGVIAIILHYSYKLTDLAIQVFALSVLNIFKNLYFDWFVVAYEQAEVLKSYRVNKETRNLWVLTALGTLTGFIFTWATAMQI